MPQTYTVRDPQSGRTVRLTGDSPPSEAELEQIFTRINQSSAPTPAPPQSSGGGLLDTAIEFGKGVIKSPLSMIETGGNLIRKIPGVAALENATGAYVDTGINTQPTNTAQTVGKVAGDLASTIVPGGMVAKATKGMGLIPRMGAEAATAAGVSTLQGGDPLTAGAIGAAVPGVGGMLGTRTATALRQSAEKKVAQALGATKERFKAIAEKRAPEILKRGITGSREALLRDATERASEAGKAIDAVLTEHGAQTVPTRSIMDALEEAKAGFIIKRDISVPKAVRHGMHKIPGAEASDAGGLRIPVVLDKRPIEQLSKLQDTIAALGDDAKVEHVVAVRRAWDRIVDQAGGFNQKAGGTFGTPLADKTEAWAKREGAGAIRKLLAEEVPDLQKVNQEFAFWNDLKKVMKATEARTQAQDERLMRTIATVGSAGIGATSGLTSGDSLGSTVGQAVVGGILGPKLLAKLTSAKWRLINANMRNHLADAIESGSSGRVMAAVARITAVQGGKLNSNPGPATERVAP